MMVFSSYLRGFLSDFLIYSNMIILGIIGLPFAIASEKWAYSFIKLYIWTCFVVLRLVANIRVECRGKIPTENVLICSKHMSFLDIIMLAYFLPEFSFVMKKEIVFTPIIGIYALRVGCVPVNRGAKSKALSKMVSDYDQYSNSQDNRQIVIYPQGTRVLPNQIKGYKVGAGVLYEKFNLPCHLVGTNTGIFWPKGSWERRSGTAVIDFFEVIEPGMPLNNFMKKIEKNIEDRSYLLMKDYLK